MIAMGLIILVYIFNIWYTYRYYKLRVLEAPSRDKAKLTKMENYKIVYLHPVEKRKYEKMKEPKGDVDSDGSDGENPDA